MDINGQGNLDGTFGVLSDASFNDTENAPGRGPRIVEHAESLPQQKTRSTGDAGTLGTCSSCGPTAQQPWIHHALRLNGRKGTTVLEVPFGDVRFGGTLCCEQLNVTGNGGDSDMIYVLQDWDDYPIVLPTVQGEEAGDKNSVQLITVHHARFRRLNNGVTVHVDVEVLLSEHTDEISVSLPLPTTATYVRVSTGMFDWTASAPASAPAVGEPQRGITVGRLEVRENTDQLVFYSPAFEPGTWRLRGQVEYEL